MSKRNIVSAFILSVAALTTLCLFATTTTAQKTPNSTAGAPLKGVDVKLGKNPGGSPAKRTTDNDGKINLSDLGPGSYWLEIVGPATEKKKGGVILPDSSSDERADYEVTITGAVGGPVKSVWNAKLGQFAKGVAKVGLGTARNAAPTYEDRLVFTIGPRTNPATPVSLTIIRAKSNITNN